MLGADEAVRVLLITPGNFYLESVLAALPNFNVTKLDEVEPATFPLQVRRHDLVVLDRTVAPALPPGNYLLIDTVAPGLPLAQAGQTAHPVIDGKGTSALVRRLDLTISCP